MEQVSRVGLVGRSSGWVDRSKGGYRGPGFTPTPTKRKRRGARLIQWKISMTMLALGLFWIGVSAGFLGLAFNQETMKGLILVLCAMGVSVPFLLKIDSWDHEVKAIRATYLLPLKK